MSHWVEHIENAMLSRLLGADTLRRGRALAPADALDELESARAHSFAMKKGTVDVDSAGPKPNPNLKPEGRRRGDKESQAQRALRSFSENFLGGRAAVEGETLSDSDSGPISPPASPLPPSRLRGRSVDFQGHLGSHGGGPGKRPGESGHQVDVAPPHSPVALRLPRNTLLSLEHTPTSPLRASSSYADSLDCLSGPLSSPVNSLHQQTSRGHCSKSFDGSARELAAPGKRRATFGFEHEPLTEVSKVSISEGEGKSDHGARPSMVTHRVQSDSLLRASLNGAGIVQPGAHRPSLNGTVHPGAHRPSLNGTVQPGAHRPSLNGTVQSALRPSASGSATPPSLTSGPSFVGADKLMDQLSRMQTAMGE